MICISMISSRSCGSLLCTGADFSSCATLLFTRLVKPATDKTEGVACMSTKIKGQILTRLCDSRNDKLSTLFTHPTFPGPVYLISKSPVLCRKWAADFVSLFSITFFFQD